MYNNMLYMPMDVCVINLYNKPASKLIYPYYVTIYVCMYATNYMQTKHICIYTYILIYVLLYIHICIYVYVYGSSRSPYGPELHCLILEFQFNISATFFGCTTFVLSVYGQKLC